MSKDTIQGIEESIKRSKKLVELGDSLERLRNHRDFKKVILEGFLEQEAIRLVHLKADPAFQTAERQASITTQIDGIGTFVQYLNTVMSLANLGAKGIEADEAAREELLAEESEDV